MDGANESCQGPRDEIPVPLDVPEAAKLVLSKCAMYEVKGTSFRVSCKICGMGGSQGIVTSTHKLVYGHFLGQPKNDIRPCVSAKILAREHPEFAAALQSRLDALNKKRK